MDSRALAPPFPYGTLLKYVGARRAYIVDDHGRNVPYIEPGLMVTVSKIRTGYRGTLRRIDAEDEGGEPLYDTTRDGYSVYYVDVPGREPFGHIIWPADAGEWEVCSTQ